MKKSIKYAGIAAATLLAVAPVAAPVVSTTTTVQADANEQTDEATKRSDALKKFADAFGDVAATDYVNNSYFDNFVLNNSNTPQDYDQFMDSNTAKFLANAGENADAITAGSKTYSGETEATIYDDLLDANANLKDANVRNIYVTASSNGKDIKTADQARIILRDNTQPEVTFTVHYEYNDVDGNPVTNQSFSFNATRDTDSALSQVNSTFTTPYNVALNQTVTDTALISGTDFKLTDQNGQSILTTDYATPSADYYYTFTAAMLGNNAINDTNVISHADGNKAPKFKKAGTYYQAIVVNTTADSALRSFITAYNTDPDANPIYINGKKASEGVDFNISNTTLRFVRAINVSSSSSQWTTTENKGVVTTKADTPYYTLVNDNNAKITNRALAKNTAWVTDQKRVDQNGNTQYRVATGEWIDANNVTFSDKATDNNEGAYTDEQALNGKVTLDGPSSFIYMLYNDNGENISNRALAGDSEWYTDKKATNAAGVTVYHVATGEWVQAGNGVNYSAY